MKNRLAFLVLLISIGTVMALAREQTHQLPKPSPEIQKLLEDAMKLPSKEQLLGLQKALGAAQAAHDDDGQAIVLLRMGNAYLVAGDPTSAQSNFKMALPIAKSAKDQPAEAAILFGLGLAVGRMGELDKALDFFVQALPVFHELNDKSGEAGAFNNIGLAYARTSRPLNALASFSQALIVFREVKDRSGEAGALNSIGNVSGDLGRPKNAVDSYTEALNVYRELKDRGGEARVLNNLGQANQRLGQPDRALEYYFQALAIHRDLKNRLNEGGTLNGIGIVYEHTDQLAKALEYYNLALAIRQELKDKAGEAATLSNAGNVYARMGKLHTALEYYEKALPLHREVRNRIFEANTLSTIGNVDSELCQYATAIDHYSQALRIYRDVRNSPGEADALNNIGVIYMNMGELAKALEYYTQALPILNEVQDRQGKADALRNIGIIYNRTGRPDLALKSYNEALPIYRETKYRSGEAENLSDTASTLQVLKLNGPAITELKQSVNIYQSLRADVKVLSKDLQQSFKKLHEDVYHRLANLLISEGRLAEAQQVLDLLKDDEYFRLLRRGAGETVAVDLTPREKEWSAKYEAVASDVTSIATAYEEEKKKDQPDETKLASMRAELAKAETAVQAFLDSAKAEFDKAGAKSNRLDDLASSQALGRVLGKLPNRPAAIYTLMTQDGVRMILKLPSVSVLRSSSSKVSATELNKKIFAFRTALTNSSLDPRPLGGELYDILIRPIEKDLVASKTQTLLWSLDGPLRYIPIWALYDAKEKRYLIEKYPSSIFTPRTIDRLAEAGDPKWSGVGFASSQAHKIGEDSFPGLPNAAQELATVSKLLGKGYADAKFTQTALVSEMEKGPEVLHIVSHFRFKPEDENGSYLVLGDGKSLSLATFKDLPEDVLGHVNLLVLSACETAMSGDADGSEFEGFALLAQLKGAGSVLATLWPVADESTALLMGEFYRIHSKNPRMAKLEALRQAQLEMLNGVTKGTAGKPRNLGIEPSKNPGFKQFVTDPKRPFAHPYYWAPFVIFGNWR